MTAKEYLRRARFIDRRIDETRERLRMMRDRMGGRISRVERIPGSRRPWTDGVDDVIDLERRLEGQIDEMCRVKNDAMDAIEGVEDAACREVLELYYLDGLSWTQVADKMHYSVRNVQLLHGKALESLHCFSL